MDGMKIAYYIYTSTYLILIHQIKRLEELLLFPDKYCMLIVIWAVDNNLLPINFIRSINSECQVSANVACLFVFI